MNSDKEKSRTYVLRLLTIRQRSKKEIFDKLKSKNYNEETIIAILDELEKSGLIDDRKFSLSFVRSRVDTKPSGRNLLRMQLISKGIDKDLINEVIEEIFSDRKEEDLAYDLATKRWKQYSKLDKIKGTRRLYSFLVRRGFNYEIAGKSVKRLLKVS